MKKFVLPLIIFYFLNANASEQKPEFNGIYYGYNPTKNQTNFIKKFIYEDVLDGLNNSSAKSIYKLDLDLERVNAQNLQTDYESNEVNGDLKYRNKQYILDGSVASINRTAADQYYISFTSTNNFQQPKAFFKDGYIDYLAHLKKGQIVHLICTGSGFEMGDAISNNCMSTESIALTKANDKVENLKTITKDIDKTDLVLMSYLISSSFVIKDNSCFSDDINNYKQCVEQLNKIKPNKPPLKNYIETSFKNLGVSKNDLGQMKKSS